MIDALPLTAVIGTAGTVGCAHLVRQVLSVCGQEKFGLITSRHCIVSEKLLPPLNRLRWQEELPDILGSMKKAGCTGCVITLREEWLPLMGEVMQLEQAAVLSLAEDGRGAARALEGCCGSLALNLDEPGTNTLARQWQGSTLTCAERRIEADLSGRNLRLLPQRLEFEALTRSELLRVRLPLGYDLYQALGAIGCGLLRGYALSDCAAALGAAPGIPGRMELHRAKNGAQVLIDCASTAEGLENLLLSARAMTTGRIHLVIGRPPGRSDGECAAMGQVCRLADRVYVTADDPGCGNVRQLSLPLRRGAGERARLITDRGCAIRSAMTAAVAEDIVVLSGRGDRTKMRVGKNEISFDERDFILYDETEKNGVIDHNNNLT